MKANFLYTKNNNSILSTYYTNYINIMETFKKWISNNLTNIKIQELYNKKYNLTEFDIYKYITALDYINYSLSYTKYNLTEGITSDKYKYNNILTNLFYMNIPEEIVDIIPISMVFGVKQVGQDIKDLTRSDKLNNLFYYNEEGGDEDSLNGWYQDYKMYKSHYSQYGGNSYTYYVFKQLLKLFLTEVYLFKYKGQILTYKELIHFYKCDIFNLDPSSIKPISELIDNKEILKVKYQCIKVHEPGDIDLNSISDLRIYLTDVNKINNLIDSYDSLIEKSFRSFWDYDAEFKNKNFLEKLQLNKNKIKIYFLIKL